MPALWRGVVAVCIEGPNWASSLLGQLVMGSKELWQQTSDVTSCVFGDCFRVIARLKLPLQADLSLDVFLMRVFFPSHICCCCLKMQPCLCLSAFIGFAANFRYRGVYPVWAGLTPSSAHSQGLCCVTRLLRRAKARQEKLKSWDEGVYLCADGSSPWWHFFQHFFLGLHRGFPWAWHPWRCASGGRKQAGHHTHFPPCWYHGMLQKSAEMGP